MSWPKLITLSVWSPVITGAGEELTLTFAAFRKSRRDGEAAMWRGNVVLEMDRHMVRKLAEQIREMQRRDRDRLARERDRLDREIEPLTRPAESQEKT